MEKQFFVYIITNKPNGILYVGVTSNLARRMVEHKEKVFEGFSKKFGLDKLVYYESYPDPEAAIIAEKRMKKWNRTWKVKRIQNMNPEWSDLTGELH